MGFDLPLAFIPPVMLVLILVIGAHRPGALIVAIIAIGIRMIAGFVAMQTASISIEAVDTITTVVSLLAVGWAISGVVFGPGRCHVAVWNKTEAK